IAPERALEAERNGAAIRLADPHEERVQLVEQRWIGRKVTLDERAGRLVIGACRKQTMARQHAAGVGVGDEDWPAGGVGEDAGYGPRSRPGDGQELAAQCI